MKKTRTMKKVASIATAALMTACLAVPMATGLTASAATGDNTITITGYSPDSAGLTHSKFAAYQIFAGTYNPAAADAAEGTRGNLTVSGWGDGINVAQFLADIKGDATLSNFFEQVNSGEVNEDDEPIMIDPYTADVKGATAVADIVKGWTDNSDEAEAFAKLAVKNMATASGTYENGAIKNVADGYYVIADVTAATNNADKGSAWSLGMLYVADDTVMEVQPKTAYPTVVKKVQEDDITTDAGYGDGYNDVADWDANTDVPFKIIGTVPSNIDDYNHYYMKFTDTMDDYFGQPENVHVFVDGEELTAAQFTKTVAEGTNDMTIEIMDLKGLNLTISSATKVTITYTAKLNATGENKAVIGLPGQQNKVKMEYSNNPNVTGDGTTAPSDENTGETNEDTVIVFTYGLDITKIDGATQEKLPNAKFILQNKAGKYAVVNSDNYFTEWVEAKDDATVLKTNAAGNFVVLGLDDDTTGYKLIEQEWSAEYNIPTTPFTVVLDATTLFSQTYMEADDTDTPAEMLTGVTGSVGGVDDTIDNDGKVSGQIANNKGTILPGTGGIGTTLFYLIGGTMFAGSGVYLISKKRMKNKEEQ